MITKAQFDEVRNIVIDNCDTHRDEFYSTEASIVEAAFDRIAASLFMDETEKAERAELKRLIEKYGRG